jgi:predicted AAA+ superfamily ATPase
MTMQATESTPFVDRLLDLPALLAKKSHFLFGPRQTGKTSLIRHTLGEAPCYDLLDSAVYLALSRHPGRLEQELTGRERVVVIDEVQRLPELLNEVHRLIVSCSADGRIPRSGSRT